MRVHGTPGWFAVTDVQLAHDMLLQQLLIATVAALSHSESLARPRGKVDLPCRLPCQRRQLGLARSAQHIHVDRDARKVDEARWLIRWPGGRVMPARLPRRAENEGRVRAGTVATDLCRTHDVLHQQPGLGA